MENDNIITLAGKFEKWSDLQQYCDAQFTTIKQQNKKIHELEAEVIHLKELLSSTTSLMEDKSKIEVPSNEQLICEMQIEKMKQIAMDREFTLEETKRFDLLNKNLLLIKNNENTKVDLSFLDEIDPAALLQIASIQDNSENTS